MDKAGNDRLERDEPARKEVALGSEHREACGLQDLGPTADGMTGSVGQVFQVRFLQRHGAFAMLDQLGLPPETLQPGGDILRIGDAAAHKEELGAWWGEGDGQFVTHPAHGIADELIFIDDQKRRPFAAEKFGFLGFQRGDDNAGIEMARDVSGANADFPAFRGPFGEFVVGQRACRDGINRLPAIFPLVRPELEDQGFSGARRGVDDHVLSVSQSGDRLLLPEIGNRYQIERGMICEM